MPWRDHVVPVFIACLTASVASWLLRYLWRPRQRKAFEAGSTKDVTKKAWPKTFFFVRHGESEYNLHYEKHHKDPMNMWDAPLTQLGKDQARSIQDEFIKLKPVDLVIASPLTRAMQTGLLAMPQELHADSRYEVNPMFAEHLEASCDIGRSPGELRQEFPTLDFDGLADVWWWVPEEHRQTISPDRSQEIFADEGRREPARSFHARVDAAAALLAKRSEQTIAVFAHADFFNTMLQRHFAKREARFADYWMKNCEIVTVTASSAEDLLSPVEEEPVQAAPVQEEPAEAVTESVKPSAAASKATRVVNNLKRQLSKENADLKPGQLMKLVSSKLKTMDQAERDAMADMEQ